MDKFLELPPPYEKASEAQQVSEKPPAPVTD
jgi:hypothetical protein